MGKNNDDLVNFSGKQRTNFAKYHLIAKVDVWASIPFAEPPLGDLRFMPPVQKRSWSGERDVSMINATQKIVLFHK